jgi:hypothetical protein
MLVRGTLRAEKPVDPIAKVRQLIRRKTSEKDRLLKEIEQCQAALAPLQQHQLAMEALDRELHELFRAVLTNSRLSKRAQRDVRGLYRGLQADQIISPDPDRANGCNCPACSRDDAVSKLRMEDLDASGPEPQRAEPEFRTRQRPEREASVRALYHKLALRFHPDRAENDERRAEHEALMRDVNDAYHAGDTERLLELSRELGIDVESLQEGGGLLAELVGQYERIKSEVRELRNSPLGALVAEVRRAHQRRYGSPIESLKEQAEDALEHLTRVRDFVREFAQGKISLKTFLRGPEFGDFLDVADSDEQFLEVLEMGEYLDQALRGSNRSGRAKSRPR